MLFIGSREPTFREKLFPEHRQGLPNQGEGEIVVRGDGFRALVKALPGFEPFGVKG